MKTTKLLTILVVGVAAAVISCGDNPPPPVGPDPVSTTPPPTTPVETPRPADAIVTLTGTQECLDPYCDYALFQLSLKNTGGVGANLNYIRVENKNGLAILELGADHFINTFGDNRLEAGRTLDFFLTSQFGYVVIVGWGDDNGNTGQAKYFP